MLKRHLIQAHLA